MHEGQSGMLAGDNLNEAESQVDFALAAPMGSAMLSLEEALQGLTGKMASSTWLQISQLAMLGIWVIEDLPKGQSVIPCSEVLKENQGHDGILRLTELGS